MGTDQRGQRVLDVAGNGRFARNVFEQAQGLSSRRLMTGGADLAELSDEQFLQLQAEDILGRPPTSSKDSASRTLRDGAGESVAPAPGRMKLAFGLGDVTGVWQ